MAKTLANPKTSFVHQQALQNRNLPEKNIQENRKVRTHLPPGQGLVKSQVDAADFIVEMLVVLCNMAKDVDLHFLNYLLEMAYEESLSHADKSTLIVKNQPQ